ncbi:hypothetical protein [Kitasatospora sp. NPDC048407]|uniref:hypothetical protein n=1 Tax=Kitasatospora sp. NPDC048407 TaxID=3364051 RepID=UPI0037226910
MENHGRRQRLAVAAVAGCLALPLLSACTPAWDRVFGVRVVDGHLVIDPARCPNEKVNDVMIRTRVNGEEGENHWFASPDTMETKVDQVDSGALAPGWTGSGDAPGLRADATYSFTVTVSRGDRPHTGAFTVDGAVLLGFGADQVVRGQGRHEQEVMTLADYRAVADSRCR